MGHEQRIRAQNKKLRAERHRAALRRGVFFTINWVLLLTGIVWAGLGFLLMVSWQAFVGKDATCRAILRGEKFLFGEDT